MACPALERQVLVWLAAWVGVVPRCVPCWSDRSPSVTGRARPSRILPASERLPIGIVGRGTPSRHRVAPKRDAGPAAALGGRPRRPRGRAPGQHGQVADLPAGHVRGQTAVRPRAQAPPGGAGARVPGRLVPLRTQPSRSPAATTKKGAVSLRGGTEIRFRHGSGCRRRGRRCPSRRRVARTRDRRGTRVRAPPCRRPGQARRDRLTGPSGSSGRRRRRPGRPPARPRPGRPAGRGTAAGAPAAARRRRPPGGGRGGAGRSRRPGR